MGLFNKWRPRRAWFAVMITLFLIGVASGSGGIVVAINMHASIGLIMIALSPVLLAAAGIAATFVFNS